MPHRPHNHYMFFSVFRLERSSSGVIRSSVMCVPKTEIPGVKRSALSPTEAEECLCRRLVTLQRRDAGFAGWDRLLVAARGSRNRFGSVARHRRSGNAQSPVEHRRSVRVFTSLLPRRNRASRSLHKCLVFRLITPSLPRSNSTP